MRRGLLTVPAALGLMATLLAGAAVAGGPMQLNENGSPMLLESGRPIRFRIDPGPLGKVEPDRIRDYIFEAFRSWDAIDHAAIEFEFDGELPTDVRTLGAFTELLDSGDSGNVVVLDNDGSIISDIYGAATADDVRSFCQTFSDDGDRISRFVIIINGRRSWPPDELRLVLRHEVGHALGLDHTQVNYELVNDGIPSNDQFIPVMSAQYSFDALDESLGPGLIERVLEFKPDDLAWAGFLYPTEQFERDNGFIVGRVIRGSGAPVLGANVLAIADLKGEEALWNRISCVSDWKTQETGAFLIPVPPGRYRLRVEPIRRLFSGGARVGPYSRFLGDRSFRDPVFVTEIPDVVEVGPGETADLGNIVVD